MSGAELAKGGFGRPEVVEMTEEKRPSMHNLIDQVIEHLERMVDEKAMSMVAPDKARKDDEPTRAAPQQ